MMINPFAIQLATAAEVLDAANYAAQQSDRWLFVALLIVFLCAILYLSKWGMKQLDTRDLRIEALGVELGKVRKDYSDFAMAITKELAGIIAQNSLVIERNTTMGETKMSMLKRIEEQISKPRT